MQPTLYYVCVTSPDRAIEICGRYVICSNDSPKDVKDIADEIFSTCTALVYDCDTDTDYFSWTYDENHPENAVEATIYIHEIKNITYI